jgi:hypothetical protein
MGESVRSQWHLRYTLFTEYQEGAYFYSALVGRDTALSTVVMSMPVNKHCDRTSDNYAELGNESGALDRR